MKELGDFFNSKVFEDLFDRRESRGLGLKRAQGGLLPSTIR